MAPPITKPPEGLKISGESSSETGFDFIGSESLASGCVVLIPRGMPHCVRQSHLTVDFFRFHLWVVMSQNPSLCQFRKKAIQATLDEMKKAGAKDGKSRFGQLFSQLASHVLRRVSKDHRREGWLHTKFQGRHHVSVEMIRSWLVSYRVCECASQCLHVYDLNDVCSVIGTGHRPSPSRLPQATTPPSLP